MSGQVTSQTSVFPPFHGTMDAPSGRLPSDRERPRGSYWLGILAASRDLLIMLLIALCRGWRPLLNRQLRLWRPLSSTIFPQKEHLCASQSLAPSRRPTATLIVLSSMRRPTDDSGRVVSHAPDSLVATARRRARVIGSWAPFKRCSYVALILDLSQIFCR